MNARSPVSLQDILKRRQHEIFVGRDEQLLAFRRNLALPLDDYRRQFIFNIFGQGGVGKTWLLRRFRQLAEEYGAITAWCDETENDVPAVMGRIVAQFEQLNVAFKTFSERYRVYRQHRRELEVDPEVPQGLSGLIGRVLAKGTLELTREFVPLGGLATNLVDEEKFASQASDWANFVARKLTNKDEVQLMLEPVAALTPLWLDDLRKVAAENKLLAFFFDTYEHIGDFLDNWLLTLLESRYGEVPANVIWAIGGRDELDQNNWSSFGGILMQFQLESFTDEQTRDYLARKGITDEHIASTILQLSGGLPLLVATLAAEGPKDPGKISDPSETAIDRFLKWVDDSRRRQVALDAALARRLNRDVLAVLVGDTDADALFSWLEEAPFVAQRADYWVYHDVVRSSMLRQKRHTSPQNWANLHGKLADHYEHLQNELGLSEKKKRNDASWQSHELDALYHRLCQAPKHQLPHALNGFVDAMRIKSADRFVFARKWSEAIRLAGVDVESDELRRWGDQLIEGIKSYEEDRYEEALKMFNALLEHVDIKSQQYSDILHRRGFTFIMMGKSIEAIRDLDQAISVDPEGVQAFIARGLIYTLTGNSESALTDFARATEIKPEDPMPLALRSLVYAHLKHYDRALADIDAALQLTSDDPRFISFFHQQRALIMIKSGDEAQAITSLLAFSKGDLEPALQDIEQLTATTPELLQYLLQFGFSVTGIDITKIDLSSLDIRKIIMFQRLMQQQMATSPDFARQVAEQSASFLSDDSSIQNAAISQLMQSNQLTLEAAIINSKGLSLSYLGHYREAIENYERALDLDGDYYPALYNIAVSTARWKGLTEAEPLIERARARLKQLLDSDQTGVATYGLGGLEALAGNTKEALEYLEKSKAISKYHIGMAKRDVAWLDLRSDPRFQAVISGVEHA